MPWAQAQAKQWELAVKTVRIKKNDFNRTESFGWLLGLILIFWKERKEDFVMRNKQVSGAGQTGLKRKQNDDRVLQNFSRLIWWERAEETQKDTRK